MALSKPASVISPSKASTGVSRFSVPKTTFWDFSKSISSSMTIWEILASVVAADDDMVHRRFHKLLGNLSLLKMSECSGHTVRAKICCIGLQQHQWVSRSRTSDPPDLMFEELNRTQHSGCLRARRHDAEIGMCEACVNTPQLCPDHAHLESVCAQNKFHDQDRVEPGKLETQGHPGNAFACASHDYHALFFHAIICSVFRVIPSCVCALVSCPLPK